MPPTGTTVEDGASDAAKLAGCTLRLALAFAIVVWIGCFYGLWFVVPKFHAIFLELGVPLPGPTEAVLLLSGPASAVLGLLVGLALVLAWRRRSARLALGVGFAGLLFGLVAAGCLGLPMADVQWKTPPAEAEP